MWTSNEAYHLPVNRNVDPILAAWINQVIATDGDFKSYKYTWDAQNLKGNKPLPQILTPEPETTKSKSKALYQGKNPAKVVGSRELQSINKAVTNGADLRGGNLIQAESDKMLNEKVAPVAQAGFGAAEVVGGMTLCASVVGCTVGGALIIEGSRCLST
ncbi:hypothetical protein [Psychrobacter lutiphocae]|uniref:hypothetical protein n=1 Tax=Psychrobacter lutiphocae TaxID=540500 RepID=UPI000361D26C|nr:hypothetical protein [Psychrobacter lutiphocae]